MMKSKCIIFILTIIVTLNAAADTINVPQMTDKVKIDGYFYTVQQTDRHLCDVAWRKAAVFKGPKDTTVYVMRDKNYLYFGFLCRNEDQERRRTEKKLHDEHEIWEDSSIELFINPDKSKNVFQFIFNSAGVFWDSKNRDKKFDIGAEVFAIGDKWTWQDWYLEIKLPISEIDPDRKSSVWGINVLRNSYASGKKKYFWMLPKGQELKLDMGKNYSHGRRYSLKHLRQIGTVPGKQFVRLRIMNPKQKNETLAFSLQLKTDGSSKTIRRSIRTEGSTRGLKNSYEIPNRSGEVRLRMAVYSPDGYECFAESYYFQVKKPEKYFAAFSSRKYFAGTRQAELYINVPDELKFIPGKYICSIKIKSLTGKIILQKQITLLEKNTKTYVSVERLHSKPYEADIAIIEKVSGKEVKHRRTGFKKENYKLF
jgi:hypothetical protein